MSTVYGKRKNCWDTVRRDIKLILRRNRLFRDTDFEVRLISTWDLEYRENDRLLKVGTGIGRGSSKWWDTWATIEVGRQLAWEPPYQAEPVGEEKRQQIVVNIQKAYRDFNIPFEILD